jgi:transcription regulator MmyB-like protein
LLWGFFTDPMIREISPDWEHAARVTVARFRAESARYPADPWFAELIEDLQRTSAQFRLWWSQHDVHGITDGHHKEWTHPTLGRLEFEHMPLQVPANPDLKLMVYTASPATAARLERLLLGTSDSSSPSPFVASSLRLMADFGESGNR